MNITDIMKKACQVAFNIVRDRKYDTLTLALNRFRVISLGIAYADIANLTEKFSFKEVYEELIIQCSEYDVEIKQLFN